MRVRANHMTVQKGGTPSRADMLDSAAGSIVRLRKGRSVALEGEQVRNVFQQARYAAPGCLHVHGHGDGIAIVFDYDEYGQVARCRGVNGLPELALTGCAFAYRKVNDLIGV